MSPKSDLQSEILYALYQLNPAEFENFVAEIWQHNGWKTEVTNTFSDNGVDVIAHRDNLFPQKYLIQTKRRGPEKKIQQNTIEKYSKLKNDQICDAVIIITTSDFTESGKKRANTLNIKLVNGSDLAFFIMKTEAIDIVEKYSGEVISSELKATTDDSQIVSNSTQSNLPNEKPHPPAESDISRTLIGLKWTKQDSKGISGTNAQSIGNTIIRDGMWSYNTPICPYCSKKDVSKNGTRERRPKGSCLVHPEAKGAVQVQDYFCNNCNSRFTTKLPFIKHGYRYIDNLRQMVKVTYAVSGLSIPMLQLICLLQFEVMPSGQRIRQWRSISTEDIITNSLPDELYSGYYTFDEQVLKIRNQKCYRLLLYDIYLHAPIAEQVVENLNKQIIENFLQTAIGSKSCIAITTDGRPGMSNIIQKDIDAKHYRCIFHLIDNFQASIDKRLRKSRPSKYELVATAIIGSEFKQIFESHSYSDAIQRLEWIKSRSGFLPKYIHKYINKVDENRSKFLKYLDDVKIPRTVKSCERYFSHTQSSVLNEKSFEIDAMQSFLQRQMVLRTVRAGLITHSKSVKLLQNNYPEINEKSIREMYTEKKKQFLIGEKLRED